MKRCLTGLTVAMLLALWIAPMAAQRNSPAEAMMAAARQKETVEGDLPAAIKQYKEIAAKYAKTDRATAAMALVRMADAYQRLGDVESRRIFQQVVKDYPEQKEAVTLAQARLGGDLPAGPVFRTVWTSNSPLDQSWSRLSPDGRFLSFTPFRNGDIFLREISTGIDRNLTNKPKDSKDILNESVFSPDGKRIAYNYWRAEDKRYTLRLLNLTGDPNPRTLYDNPDPDAYDLFLYDWSRDGKIAVTVHRNDKTVQIGYVSVSDGKLHVLRTLAWEGGGTMRLTMRFSPDGKYLGYDRTQSATKDVFLLALDGSPEIQAVEHPGANDVMGSWSPDGKWLLFISDRFGTTDLWAVAFTEGRTQGLPQRLRLNIGGNFQPLGWTPAGALYYKTDTFNFPALINIQLGSLDLTNGTFNSTTMAARSSQERTSSPKWSPDGKYLAYLSELRNGLDRKLVIRATDTGAIRELRPRQLSLLQDILAWAPDRRSLLVAALDLQRQDGGFYRVDTETGEAVAVVINKPPDSGLLDFQGMFPDGLSFLIGFSTGGLYRVDTQTGGMSDMSARLLNKSPNPGALPPPDPTFSPDGNIVYLRTFPGASDAAFFARDLATGQEKELIRRSVLGAINPSPDGRYIATTFASSVVLLIPTAGGEARELMRVSLSSEGKAGVRVVSWVPDGGSVLVQVLPSDRTRESEFWLVPLSGADPKRVVGDVSIPSSANLSLSPDGRHFAYTIREPAPPVTFEVAVLENFLPKPAKK